MKYLLWAALLYLGWRWYLSKKSQPTSPPQEAAATTDETSAAGVSTEKMVACAHCGIHLPMTESVQGTGALHFCSEEHRLRHSSH